MSKIFYSRKAQSLVEMGAFGVLVLSAFAVLVTFVQKMNGEQFTLMENFRHSLKWSHDQNVIVSHADLDDSRQADVNAPLRRQRIMRSASGYVHWAVPTIKTNVEEQVETTPEGRVIWRLDTNNEPERDFVYEVLGHENLLPEDPENDLKEKEVRGVELHYSTHIGDNFVVDESKNAIKSTRSHSSGEVMEYEILGPGRPKGPVYHTIYGGREDGGSRTFSVAK